MITIEHRSSSHKISQDTEILIIGTFNPDTPENNADFFYGRRQNYLWRFLPLAFGEPDLKSKETELKKRFIKKYKIGFIDLIAEVQVEEGMQANYIDNYIDNRVSLWKDVISEMEKLKSLNKVCFTRKTFSGVPNIKKRVLEIENYCRARDIIFKLLITPSRIYSQSKQNEWTNFFV